MRKFFRSQNLTGAALASVSALALLTTETAFAQSSDAGVFDEVIVTARKTEETLQEVPLAITAFTADDIKKKGIQELEDVALLTPGLTFEDFSNAGFGTPVIRGATQFSLTNLEQNVSTFIDGIYIPRSYAIDVGTSASERIEVVKGPQSSLYGANAFLGAINYVSQKADLEEFGGTVKGTIGDGGRRDISGSVSIPLQPGVLAVKLDAEHTEFDGDFDNLITGFDFDRGTDDTLGGWDTQKYGISAIFQPSDNVKVDVGYNRIEALTESRAQTRLNATSGDFGFGAPPSSGFAVQQPGVFVGELPDTPIEPFAFQGQAAVIPASPFAPPGTLDTLVPAGTAQVPTGFAVDPRTFADKTVELIRGQIEIDVTDKVGLTYQLGNVKGEIFAPGGSDRDPLAEGLTSNTFSFFPTGNFDYLSNELRVDYQADSGIYALAGVFHSEGEDNDLTSTFGLASPPLFSDPTATTINEDFIDGFDLSTTDVENFAVFGRVEIPLLDDKLKVSAEGRYAEDRKTGTDDTGTFEFVSKYFVPRVSLDYTTDDGQLLYASFARGVKSGGVNPAVIRVPAPFGALVPLPEDERFFDDDENSSFEIGAKTGFLDDRLLFNIAAFYIDWSNLQVQVAADGASVTGTLITDNLGSASSKGIEADFNFKATDAITLNGGLSLTDASYDDDVISQRIVRAGVCIDDDVCPADGSIGGNTLQRSSSFQWNVGAQYDGILTSEIDYFLRADYAGQSKQYVSELNLAEIPSRALLNLRAGLSHGNWSADIWATNVTDEEYVSNAFYVILPFGADIIPTFGNRRRIGATLSYDF